MNAQLAKAHADLNAAVNGKVGMDKQMAELRANWARHMPTKTRREGKAEADRRLFGFAVAVRQGAG